MRYILTSEQMQKCDANTMDGYGVPSAVLMERAACSAVEVINEAFPDPGANILIACGTGNNGGDGLAMARLLFLKGHFVTVLFPGEEEKCSEEAARQLGIVRKYGIEVIKQLPSEEFLDEELSETAFDVVVDALFGIGLSRDIEGNFRTVIEDLNALSAMKVAVDIPSGLSADTGKVMGTAFCADVTVTFGFAKIGQLLYPGADCCGDLIVQDIGIDEMSLPGVDPDILMAEPEDLALLPKRENDTNKGSYGKLLIVAGSFNMAGAAAFSAQAAYRCGAGLVRVVTDVANREIIQTLVPEAILATYDEKTDMEAFVKEQTIWADAIVLGPGIGRARQAENLVQSILAEATVPCLTDADGLNILASHPEWVRDSKAKLLITPHPGEMSRLAGTSVLAVRDDLIGAARSYADEYCVITVLKDARTIIRIPGEVTWINTTGNNGMATAGSGDVLTGIIGALLGQGLPASDAAILGVLIHGMAGDAAAESVGKTSLMASDLINGICMVLKGQ